MNKVASTIGALSLTAAAIVFGVDHAAYSKMYESLSEPLEVSMPDEVYNCVKESAFPYGARAGADEVWSHITKIVPPLSNLMHQKAQLQMEKAKFEAQKCHAFYNYKPS